MAHPIQNVIVTDGALHFEQNKIVRFLYDWARAKGMGLNELAIMPFDDNDREQFAQLLGYSLSGYQELPYASQEVISDAKVAGTLAMAKHKRKNK